MTSDRDLKPVRSPAALVGRPSASGTSRFAVFVFGLNMKRVGGIEVHTRELTSRLGELGWSSVLCVSTPPASAVREYLSHPNVCWEVLPTASLSTWQGSRDLLGILHRYRPAILHLQFTSFLSVNPWIARLAGVTCVAITDHNSRPEGYVPDRQPVWKRAVGRLLSLPVNFAVAVSEHNRTSAATLGTFPRAKLHRIYDGADLEPKSRVGAATARQWRERCAVPQGRIVVTHISQLRPEKGVYDVLEAARLALDRDKNIHFVFVGEGRDHAALVSRARHLGIEASVTWAGLIVDPAAEGVFAASDILCVGSRWQEAFGFVIAEAMAWELPVVSTRVGAIPEIVSDGETGFLVDPGDFAEMADRLVRLAHDEALRRRFGRQGRIRAEACFDVKTNVDRLLTMYGNNLPL